MNTETETETETDTDTDTDTDVDTTRRTVRHLKPNSVISKTLRYVFVLSYQDLTLLGSA